MASIIRRIIQTTNAPKASAVYNQAIVADRTVYVSGCLGIDKNTMKLVPGGIKEQTEQVLRNLKTVLEASDSGFDKIVKNTVFLKEINDFGLMNEVYSKYFVNNCPARTTIQIAGLPMNALIEIECIALTGNVKTVLE